MTNPDLPARLPGQLDVFEVIELISAEGDELSPQGATYCHRIREGSVSRRMRQAASTGRSALPTPPKRLSVAEIVQQRLNKEADPDARRKPDAGP